MIILEREPGSLNKATLVGRDNYYETMIAMAGGVNAYQGLPVRYPAISAEGIQRIDPDVIIEIDVTHESNPAYRQQRLQDWQQVPNVKAVKNGRVFIFTENYTVRPGPRFILFLQDLAQAIHPELF